MRKQSKLKRTDLGGSPSSGCGNSGAGLEMITISEAATRVGMPPNTFLRHRKRLGIPSYGYRVNWAEVVEAFTSRRS